MNEHRPCAGSQPFIQEVISVHHTELGYTMAKEVCGGFN